MGTRWCCVPLTVMMELPHPQTTERLASKPWKNNKSRTPTHGSVSSKSTPSSLPTRTPWDGPRWDTQVHKDPTTAVLVLVKCSGGRLWSATTELACMQV